MIKTIAKKRYGEKNSGKKRNIEPLAETINKSIKNIREKMLVHEVNKSLLMASGGTALSLASIFQIGYSVPWLANMNVPKYGIWGVEMAIVGVAAIIGGISQAKFSKVKTMFEDETGKSLGYALKYMPQTIKHLIYKIKK
jgi:hypothetical protein